MVPAYKINVLLTSTDAIIIMFVFMLATVKKFFAPHLL